MGKLIEGEDEKLNEQYKWLSEKKRKNCFLWWIPFVRLLESILMMDPEVQELEENIRKIAENEKEEAHQEEQ